MSHTGAADALASALACWPQCGDADAAKSFVFILSSIAGFLISNVPVRVEVDGGGSLGSMMLKMDRRRIAQPVWEDAES